MLNCPDFKPIRYNMHKFKLRQRTTGGFDQPKGDMVEQGCGFIAIENTVLNGKTADMQVKNFTNVEKCL